MIAKWSHIKRQAGLFALFSLLVGVMNIMGGVYTYLWDYFVCAAGFITLLFVKDSISAYVQTALILFNGFIVVIFGDVTVGMLFIMVSIYSLILYTPRHINRKPRYAILVFMALLADILKVLITKDRAIVAFGYGLLFLAIVIFIDNLISRIIEKEKQKVREELKKKDAVISNLSELLKETIITSEELIEIANQLKGGKNGTK